MLANDTTVIAVAANLARTIEPVQELFSRQTGHRVKISLASSGVLTQQILNGAPYSLFLSADPVFIEKLVNAGITAGSSTHYATGRICFFIPESSPFKNTKTLPSLISRLTHGDYSRLALAHPGHAPYGRAAATALQRAGIWALDRRKIVIGENIAQTYQFASHGTVDLGVIAWSHFLAGKTGECLLIPEYWHEPIEQHMILLDSDNKVASAFFNFMQSVPARKLLTEHGYGVPGAR